MDELQHIIEQKQALPARETVSCPALDYSAGMTSEEQKRYQLAPKILNFIKSNKIISDFGDIAKYIGEHDLLKIMDTLPENKSITLKFEDTEICVKKISSDILELYLAL